MHRPLALTCAAVLMSFTTPGQAQQPSSVVALLQPPTTEIPLEQPREQFIHRSGMYAAGGILISPPMLFDYNNPRQIVTTFLPIPSSWGAVGFRRESDVSWQTSFLLVPLASMQGGLALVTTGLDTDRISTNRTPDRPYDLRWQAGVRMVGVGLSETWLPVGLGPHIGLRWEKPLPNGLFLHCWGDVGILPSLFFGIPFVDLRSEVALKWRPVRFPGLSMSVGAFNEVVGFGVGGSLMTPGITARLGWNF